MKVSLSLKVVIHTAILVTSFFFTQNVIAQGTRSDYERARNLRKNTANKVFKQRIKPNWFSDKTKFWYQNDLADKTREYILVDAERGTRQRAFDHERLAAALAKATKKDIQADRLPISRLKFLVSDSVLQFTSQGQRWNCNLNNYEIQAVSPDDQLQESLPQTRLRASGSSQEETYVTFINRTKNNVELYWIDTSRQRQRYTTLQAGKQHRQHTYAGHVWLVANPEGKRLAVFTATQEEATAVIDENTKPLEPESRRSRSNRQRGRSPDGKWRAFFKDHNLFIQNLDTEKEFALTHDGTEAEGYAERLYWSPDSQKLVALHVQKGGERKVNLIESSPKDQLQPKLHTFTYTKPGDKITIRKPHLFDVSRKKQISISDELFKNPWSISDMQWRPDSGSFTFLYNQRGHQVLRIIGVDAINGKTRAVIEEKSKTFIDYAGKRFSRQLHDTKEIIWMSERDGWNHLYLYDVETGKVKNQITTGKWVVRGVEQIDEKKRQIWFRAGGIRTGQDPYYIHFCRINFDGSNLVILTEGFGTHDIQFSPDRRFFIDRWSRVDQPPVSELRDAQTGRDICELEQADWDELNKTGWRAPEPFVTKGRDGKTDIYGIIIRPSNFDPKRTYPVIEQIYAGPHSAFVPKSFGLQTRQHAIAELGFIVVQIDGMGTSHRSKAFHDICWKNLGDSGFPDRILWMKAAAAKYPYMDITRVGIYGGSAGGQSALRALLAFGDFYKVAVADCGCHDNRMDKIWWNELWMGWPIGPHYEKQSNVTQAHKLTGKLFLTVGELDRNVDPSSTMQVVDALIKADKDFDLLLVPGKGHGVGETPYASRRRMDFFVRHLLGVEPRRDL
jgi:dipeptidyl-peptidase 4